MKKSDIEFRNASQQDVEQFYEGTPPVSMIAMVAVLEGKVIAIGGVCFAGKVKVGFSEMKPEMRPRKKDIVRFAKLVMSRIKQYNHVIVFANPEEKGADTLIRRLGFEYQGRTAQGEAYLWQQPH